MKRFLANFWRVASHPSAAGIRYFVVIRFFILQFIFRFRRPIAIKFLNRNIPFDFNKTGVTSTYYHGLNEPHDMLFLGKLLNSKFSFIDVGANIGLYTLLASIAGARKTIAFEPDLINFEQLTSNVKSWNCKNIEIRNHAVGNKNGYVTLKGHDVAVHIADFEEHTSHNSKVKCTILDELIPDVENSSVVLKIDTEGYEEQILNGADALLRSGQVHTILIEINSNNVNSGASMSIIAILNNLGYKSCRYDIQTEMLIEVDGYNKCQDNTIFIRNKDIMEFNNSNDTGQVYELLKKQRKKIFNFTCR